MGSFLADGGLCLFDDGSHVFLHSRYGAFSSVDLSVSDPFLFLDFGWSVGSGLHGCGHFPLVLVSAGPEGTVFESLCLGGLIGVPISGAAVDGCASVLLGIADGGVHGASGGSVACGGPWFNGSIVSDGSLLHLTWVLLKSGGREPAVLFTGLVGTLGEIAFLV